MKMVTMVDSYKKTKWLPLLFLFVFLEEIYLKDKYESIFAYVQLHFILNIIMYYSFCTASFLRQKTLKTLFSFNSQ